MGYIFFSFSVKKSFSEKKKINIKLFFSTNNVYYVKHKYSFKKKIFFQLSFAINEQPQVAGFEKFINFSGKQQWWKLNRFIFLINTIEKDSMLISF